ncbi:MAG: Hsp20/alpha crystallin family protein [Planctomycetes bacterium]|nr:Hsp20/alpha crystallin family protein [Planctomycetota bacterium]
MRCCETTENNRTEVAKPEQVGSNTEYAPAVDIRESADEFVLVTDVPGASAEDVDARYERGTLTIRARVKPRRQEDASFLLREYGVGDFRRAFEIGEGIDASGIQAEVADGVLTLHLPKAPAAKVRTIKVKGA